MTSRGLSIATIKEFRSAVEAAIRAFHLMAVDLEAKTLALERLSQALREIAGGECTLFRLTGTYCDEDDEISDEEYCPSCKARWALKP